MDVYVCTYILKNNDDKFQACFIEVSTDLGRNPGQIKLPCLCIRCGVQYLVFLVVQLRTRHRWSFFRPIGRVTCCLYGDPLSYSLDVVFGISRHIADVLPLSSLHGLSSHAIIPQLYITTTTTTNLPPTHPLSPSHCYLLQCVYIYIYSTLSFIGSNFKCVFGI